MSESSGHVIKFLEKEIKTYLALSLFLSKQGINRRVKKALNSPAFYKDRMKEAEKLVHELRKPN